VHSGGTVNTGHRKISLEFALGESAVVARTEWKKLQENPRQQQTRFRTRLPAFRASPCITLAQFEKLQQMDDVDTKIVTTKSYHCASNVASILSKALPVAVVEQHYVMACSLTLPFPSNMSMQKQRK